VLLLGGLGGTTWGLVEARAQERRAERAEDSESEQRRLADDRAEAAEVARRRAERAEADGEQRAEPLQTVVDFQAARLGEIDVAEMAEGLRESIVAEARDDASRVRLEAVLEPVNLANVAMDALERNIFDRTIAAVDENFADQPLVQARLLHSTAEMLREIGLLEAAIDPHERALEIRRAELAAESPEPDAGHDAVAAQWRAERARRCTESDGGTG